MLYELNETEGCCEMCGRIFKPGDMVHELEVWGEITTVCGICYKNDIIVVGVRRGELNTVDEVIRRLRGE